MHCTALHAAKVVVKGGAGKRSIRVRSDEASTVNIPPTRLSNFQKQAYDPPPRSSLTLYISNNGITTTTPIVIFTVIFVLL